MSGGSSDAERLERYLIERGATPAELREAAATGTLGTLALELALRSPGERVPFIQAVSQAGVEIDDARAMWRALGFPDPARSSPSMTESQIEGLAIFGEMHRRLGRDTMLQLARVIGGSVAQIAEALVDAFRVNVEMPRRAAGKPYPDVVADYSNVAAAAIPALGRAITDALKAHLVAVSGSTWGLDAERATITRELTVGFADLVGYAASVRSASPAELAATVSRFERRVAEVVDRFGGRVVKLIGDEAMFVVGEPAAGCALAAELRQAIADDSELPAARIGLAAGPVVSHRGDYYGDVVNLAARLVKVAEPGEVLASESVVGNAAGVNVEPAGHRPLKGFDDGVDVYRLVRPPL